jgi:hypothetical protein
MKKYKIGFSLFGFIAFILQEIPYLPWLFWPPVDNPLANNDPANIFLGILEQAGGILTVAFLILLSNKSVIRLNFRNKHFIFAIICLVIYYLCWICYFAGITNGWLIVIGLSAIVPLYYFFIALLNKNIFAIISSILFFIGHTGSNIINYL